MSFFPEAITYIIGKPTTKRKSSQVEYTSFPLSNEAFLLQKVSS